MRNALGLILASLVAAVAIAGIWYFTASPRPSASQAAAARPSDALLPGSRLASRPAPKDDVETTGSIANRLAAANLPATPAPAAAPAAAPKAAAGPKTACANPNALGVSRVVGVDTTGGPGFGFDHFKQLDFLNDHEVVLTFDDGPWPVNTPAVLKALDDECVKAVFFPVGKHATYHPDILKKVVAAGHTVGSHTWSHVNLNGKKMTEQQAIEEVEKGFSAVKQAIGSDPAPFFRFPQLQHNPSTVAYLGTRNVAMFSTDVDSFDFKSANADQVINTIMKGLEKKGKGIILMHDFQKHTGEAMPALLQRLKAGGYKIVHMQARAPLQTLPEYDAMLVKDQKLPVASARPVSAVVQTISQ